MPSPRIEDSLASGKPIRDKTAFLASCSDRLTEPFGAYLISGNGVWVVGAGIVAVLTGGAGGNPTAPRFAFSCSWNSA